MRVQWASVIIPETNLSPFDASHRSQPFGCAVQTCPFRRYRARYYQITSSWVIPETNDDTKCLSRYHSADGIVILHTEDAGTQYPRNVGGKTEANTAVSMRYSIVMGSSDCGSLGSNLFIP